MREDKHSYLLDVFRARLEFPQLRRKIVEQARQWGAQLVLIEDASSGQSLIQDLKQNDDLPSGCYLEPIPVVRDKVERAQAASIAIEAGRVHLPPDAPWLKDLKVEIRNFPRGHDDQVDSMAQLICFVENRVIYAKHIDVRWPT